VPTPFQHLVYAERVVCHPALPEPVRAVLRREPGAYLLGSTAGDVQTVSGQSRPETHFHRISDGPAVPATYPQLADPYSLAEPQAAFVSGYLTHLVWDELWAWEIFVPFYRDNAARWPDRRAYSLNHNALRVLLDRTATAALRHGPALLALLQEVTVDAWLPFVPVWALKRWRDWLVGQLSNPDAIETAQVFADRMHLPVDELERAVEMLAGDPDAHVSGLTAALARYEAAALRGSLTAVAGYWQLSEGSACEGECKVPDPEVMALGTPDLATSCLAMRGV